MQPLLPQDKEDKELATKILSDIVDRYPITPSVARWLISHLSWLLEGQGRPGRHAS